MRNIYVASSWRNPHQPYIVSLLKLCGHNVYDFRHPTTTNRGFHWSEIDKKYLEWNCDKFREALLHPIACNGFRNDIQALQECDTCLLVLPCGRSAHTEFGYAIGAKKDTIILMLEPTEPELMYKMAYKILVSIEELQDYLTEFPDPLLYEKPTPSY